MKANSSNSYEYIQRGYIDSVRNIVSERKLELGNELKFFTQTFGCQQNVSDTEKIDGMLEEMGFIKTEDKADADVIIYNTCAVREHAEQKVFGKIGELVQYKRKKPSLIIGLCGCMMQHGDVADTIKKKYGHVDIVFGTAALYRLPQNLYKVMSLPGTRVSDTDISVTDITENVPVRRTSGYSAWVSIMYGCDNFCSYCIVPYVRGRERSRDPETVVTEIKSLVDDGYKEITLLGQNVNSYCRSREDGYNFSSLLRDIDRIPGDFRIRFMTSHPKDATHELIDTMASGKNICHHLHLPFQSGNDRILKAMNRKYTRDEYLSLINYAKSRIPDVVITSDVIVGFPTETDSEFDDTISLINEVGFGGLYTFIYSPRSGTPAAKMEQVSEEAKKERFERLVKLQTESSFAFNLRYVGKTIRVLCEGLSEGKSGIYTGRTDGGIIVNFTGDGIREGSFTDVEIDKALNWAIFGKAVK